MQGSVILALYPIPELSPISTQVENDDILQIFTFFPHLSKINFPQKALIFLETTPIDLIKQFGLGKYRAKP